jgi:hypothetical protein
VLVLGDGRQPTRHHVAVELVYLMF